MNPIPLPNEYEYNAEDAIKYIQEMKKKENLEWLNKRSKELTDLVSNHHICSEPTRCENTFNELKSISNEISIKFIIDQFGTSKVNWFEDDIAKKVFRKLPYESFYMWNYSDDLLRKLIDICILHKFEEDKLTRTASFKILKKIIAHTDDLYEDENVKCNIIRDIIYKIYEKSERKFKQIKIINLFKREIINLFKRYILLGAKYNKLGFRIPDRIHDRYDLYLSKYKPKTYSEYEKGFIRVLGDKI